MLDARSAAISLILLAVSATVAKLTGHQGAFLAVAALSPAAVLHVTFTFPVTSTLVRYAPSVVLVPYALCGVLSALSVRAGADEETQALVSSVTVVLLALSGAALVARMIRFSLRSEHSRSSQNARLTLAGAAVSTIGLLAWGRSGYDAPLLLGAGVLPAAIAFAVHQRHRTWIGVRAEVSGSPQTGTLSLEEAARGIAHAMLKPVAAADQELRLLAPELEDPAVRSKVESASELMAQLQRLVRDLLDLSRARDASTRRRANLLKLIEQAARAVSERFGDASIELEVQEDLVVVDEVSVRCMLVNLLENALEAGGGAGWVRVQTRSDANFIQVAVEDRGGGLPPEIRERLFQPFLSTKPRGTGLGLALVREISRAHRGDVVANPTPEGTRFVVTLPKE